MLSDFQRKILWDAWLSAEIRAAYFAALGFRFQTRQKRIMLVNLLLTSGATLTLLLAIVPPGFGWARPLLGVLATATGIWANLSRSDRHVTDCADLHFRWNILAMDYSQLWANTYSGNATDTLTALRKREAEISRSSMSMPDDTALMGRMQDSVVMQHQPELVAFTSPTFPWLSLS
jgi:hypothetical protein